MTFLAVAKDSTVIAAIIVAVSAILAWVQTRSKAAGAAEERKKSATKNEQLEGRIADAEAEVERSKPLSTRLRDLRERIASRRGVGKLP